MNKKIIIPLILIILSFSPFLNYKKFKKDTIQNKEITVEEKKIPNKKVNKTKKDEEKYENKIFEYEQKEQKKERLKNIKKDKIKKQKKKKRKDSNKNKEQIISDDNEPTISKEEYQALLDKENESSNIVNLGEKEKIAQSTINLSEQELKARAQFLKDDNGGWVPDGEIEPYDLAQPNPADLIIYQDNTNIAMGDTYNNYFIDKDQAFNNSISYSYPYGPIYPLETENKYTIEDLEYHGAMIWNGYKYTFYSQKALPGNAMEIPQRHIEDGFIVDGKGYISAASDYYPKGTILDSPFGKPVKIRDVFWHNQPEYRIDIYTR